MWFKQLLIINYKQQAAYGAECGRGLVSLWALVKRPRVKKRITSSFQQSGTTETWENASGFRKRSVHDMMHYDHKDHMYIFKVWQNGQWVPHGEDTSACFWMR